MKATSKMKTPQKLAFPSKFFLPPPPPHKKLPEILTLTATRQLMSNGICYQVSKLEMEFHMIDINIRRIAHARINRKDDIFMQRRLRQNFTCTLEWGQGTRKKSRPCPAWAYTTFVVLGKTLETFSKCTWQMLVLCKLTHLGTDFVLVQIPKKISKLKISWLPVCCAFRSGIHLFQILLFSLLITFSFRGDNERKCCLLTIIHLFLNTLNWISSNLLCSTKLLEFAWSGTNDNFPAGIAHQLHLLSALVSYML